MRCLHHGKSAVFMQKRGVYCYTPRLGEFVESLLVGEISVFYFDNRTVAKPDGDAFLLDRFVALIKAVNIIPAVLVEQVVHDG